MMQFKNGLPTRHNWSALTIPHQSKSVATGRMEPETLQKCQRLQEKFWASTDLGELLKIEPMARRTEIERSLTHIIDQTEMVLTPDEYSQCITFILNEALGYGPLSNLVTNPTITEIMVNGPDQVFVEQHGKLRLAEGIVFNDEDHLRSIIDRIVARVGRRIDEASPSVDARLEDGSRVNILIPPLSLDGPILTIRKFEQTPYRLRDLVKWGTLRQDMADFLQAAVQSRLSIVISGGTGAGKTTVMNALGEFIGSHERIVTVEDSAELKLRQQHPHVVRTETRPPNVQGTGAVTVRDLVRNALRMRPDRIIVGEVRGAEAQDMLQAMNTGHEGSMTTLHANSAEDALRRIETMVRWAEGAANLPNEAIREQIASAIDLIVQVSRFGPERKVASISEIQGMHHGKITVKEIFRFDIFSIDPVTRQVEGSFDATGVVPINLPRLEVDGTFSLRRIFRSMHIEEKLHAYMADDSVTEIMINGPHEAYIERSGEGLTPISLDFRSEAHLISLIKSITAASGKVLDEKHPIVEDRLPDGSRISAVLPPISQTGPVLTIRRFPKSPLQMDNLVRFESLIENMADFLQACVRAKFNILISGGTGTGKTTMLNALTAFVDSGHHERIITIEDVAEIQLQHDHWVRLEARPADEYGEGGVSIRELVRSALRMRPDRIIVGEVRGAEALDMLQAMNTGHDGSMTTIHANSPEDAFSRLETMVALTGTDLPARAVHSQIVGALDIIVQISRESSGVRRVTSIAEVIKDRERFAVNEIYSYKVLSDPKVLEHDEHINDSEASQMSEVRSKTGRGQHFCLNSQPTCLDRMKQRGVILKTNILTPVLRL